MTFNNLPMFFKARKIERIFPYKDLKQKFGLFSDFFEFNYDYNVILFIDKTKNTSNIEYINNNQNVLKALFKEKKRNFVIAPLEHVKIDETIYRYYFPISNLKPKIHNVSPNRETINVYHDDFLDLINYQGTFKTGFISIYKGQIRLIEKNDYENIEFFINQYLRNLHSEEVLIARETIRFSFGLSDEPALVVDKETEKIISDIKLKVKQLVESGNFFTVAPILEKLLKENYLLNLKPSPIKITSDYRIFLTEYNIEIKMNHLTKAVYLLFLKEKCINLTELSLHKEKLLSIYKHISYKNSLEDMEKTIDSLVDLETKLIYVHLSRIKSAFIREVSESIAEKYYVAGYRNKPKEALIEKESIIWETNF